MPQRIYFNSNETSNENPFKNKKLFKFTRERESKKKYQRKFVKILNGLPVADSLYCFNIWSTSSFEADFQEILKKRKKNGTKHTFKTKWCTEQTSEISND